MATIEQVRSFFAQIVARNARAKDPRIERAFAETDRAAFLGPGPWALGGYPNEETPSTPSDDPVFVYQNVVFFIDKAAGITNGEPGIHALFMSALGIKPGEAVLHIGAGVGYYTSMLADLVGPDGRVEAYEVHEPTALRAQSNLSARTNIAVHARSGAQGPLPDADVIYVNAGATRPMPAWLDALKPRGRLLLPLTGQDYFGAMFLITREASGFAARVVSPVGIIPRIGGRADNEAAAIAAAFGTNAPHAVRSLRRAPEVPDETAWLTGEGWWLSTQALH